MAENPKEHRSKIPVPQYSRTTTPILSTERKSFMIMEKFYEKLKLSEQK